MGSSAGVAAPALFFNPIVPSFKYSLSSGGQTDADIMAWMVGFDS